MIEIGMLYLIILAMLISSFMISGYLGRRATHQVIERFCSYDALEEGRARKAEELGLITPDFYQRFFKPRDYKPYALQFLSKAGVVRVTDENKLYLVEEKLHDEFKCKRG